MTVVLSSDSSNVNRRRFLKHLSGLVAGAALGLALGDSIVTAAPTPTRLQTGDLILGRTNTTQWWGHWRHVGIFAGNGLVIEGGTQSMTRPVVGITNLTEFCGRYVNVVLYRAKFNPAYYGKVIVSEANKKVNQNLYCSALVKAAYESAYQTTLSRRLLYPDDITSLREFSQILQ